MGTQPAHRVVVKKNTTTEDTYNNTEEIHREGRKFVRKKQWPAQTCITEAKWNSTGCM